VSEGDLGSVPGTVDPAVHYSNAWEQKWQQTGTGRHLVMNFHKSYAHLVKREVLC